MNKPTPPPSGRTAEEITNGILLEFLGEIDGVAPEDWDDFAMSDQVQAKQTYMRQLFDAMVEIVGRNDRVVSRSLMFDSGYKIGRYELRAELRERLRVFFGQLNDWRLTQGAQAVRDWAGMVRTVQGFNDFTPDNDPYGEHDSGAFDWESKRLFWKIDYYDQKLENGEDPLSAECRRVLTVMLTSEY